MKTGYTGKPVEATDAPPSSPVNLLAERKRPVVAREVKRASMALMTLVMCTIVTILVMCL